MDYGVPIWDMAYRYGIWRTDMGYGVPIWDMAYRYGIWRTDMRYGVPYKYCVKSVSVITVTADTT